MPLLSYFRLKVRIPATQHFQDFSAPLSYSSFLGGIAIVTSVTIAIATDTHGTVPFPHSIAITVAVAVAVAIIGLGVWRRLEFTSENERLHILAVFAVPWFCWFPVTCSMSTLALYNLLMKTSPFSLPIWQQTAVVALAITALSAALWWRGQWLDARARNPFQSGPIGAALGVKR